MSLIRVNGVAIPTPSDIKFNVMDITNSERNANGTMIMELIAQKQKIELSWNFLKKEDLNSIISAVDGIFFQVTYPNPKTGILTTKTMYSGDRTMSALDYINGNIRYKDVKMSFIER